MEENIKNKYLEMAENWVNEKYLFVNQPYKNMLVTAYLNGIDKGLDLVLDKIIKIK